MSLGFSLGCLVSLFLCGAMGRTKWCWHYHHHFIRIYSERSFKNVKQTMPLLLQTLQWHPIATRIKCKHQCIRMSLLLFCPHLPLLCWLCSGHTSLLSVPWLVCSRAFQQAWHVLSGYRCMADCLLPWKYLFKCHLVKQIWPPSLYLFPSHSLHCSILFSPQYLSLHDIIYLFVCWVPQ